MEERSIRLGRPSDEPSQAVVDSLSLVGLGAAIIRADSTMLAVNDGFHARMGKRLIDGPIGARFADRSLNAQIAMLLEHQRTGRGEVQSIALPAGTASPPMALHLMPIAGAAGAMCPPGATLLIISEAETRSGPSAVLLQTLFALTPTESRVACHLLDGGTVANATGALGIGEGTVRSHLKSIFAKTGVSRQSDLVRLLIGFAPPHTLSRKGTISRSLSNGRGGVMRVNSN